MLTKRIHARYALTFSLAGLLLLSGTTYSQDDRAEIERLVFRIQQGVQMQSIDLVLKYYRPDSIRGHNEIAVDKQGIRQSLDALLTNFTDRNLPAGLEGLNATADFKLRVKEVTFFEEGRRAELELQAGFAALPPDANLLRSKSEAEVEAMSEVEKEIAMKYRPLTIQVLKLDGTWYVTSFSGFSGVLSDINQAYPGGALPVKGAKRKE